MQIQHNGFVYTTQDVKGIAREALALHQALISTIPDLWDADDSLPVLMERVQHVKNVASLLDNIHVLALGLDIKIHTLDTFAANMDDYGVFRKKLKEIRFLTDHGLADHVLNRIDEIGEGMIVPEAYLD